MQRKPGFPVANCSIKVPDNSSIPEAPEDETDAQQRRLQLINFGHAQWGFNNWNWLVTKQELDFVDITGGKYTAGVAAFVSVSVKSLDIHRENVGYATTVAATKGMAIHGARKCAVTNALRETLLSFGGAVASELLEALEPVRGEVPAEPAPENSPGLANLPGPPAGALAEPRNSPLGLQLRKEAGGGAPGGAKALPAASRPPANAPRPPAPLLRPASNVSFVLQPVLGGVLPQVFAPPRLAAPPAPPPPPAYYEYGPWHFAYEPPHGNVNLNFNLPPRNLVVNGRAASADCKHEPPYGPQPPQGCWIKPTIFYDGFWTEQKVKKWVAEQVEKQFPEEPRKPSSPANAPNPKA